VKNIGDTTAVGVSVSVTLPQGSILIGGGPCPTYNNAHAIFICPVLDLAPNDNMPGGGDEAAITVITRAPFSTRNAIVATTAIVAATNEPSAANGNNTASTTILVGGCPDLNDDGIITIGDLVIAASAMGKHVGDIGYNPLADQDNDGVITIADIALMEIHFFQACRGIDSDRDGLSDHEETATYLTDPGNADTDGDGLPDGVEVRSYGSDPHNPDTDNDGYTDGMEAAIGKSPILYCLIMRADLATDGIVTIGDMAKLIPDYSRHIPPASPRLDQNFDNMITIGDLAVIARVFAVPVSACP
jgi:hypothetical protein